MGWGCGMMRKKIVYLVIQMYFFQEEEKRTPTVTSTQDQFFSLHRCGSSKACMLCGSEMRSLKEDHHSLQFRQAEDGPEAFVNKSRKNDDHGSKSNPFSKTAVGYTFQIWHSRLPLITSSNHESAQREACTVCQDRIERRHGPRLCSRCSELGLLSSGRGEVIFSHIATCTIVRHYDHPMCLPLR